MALPKMILARDLIRPRCDECGGTIRADTWAGSTRRCRECVERDTGYRTQHVGYGDWVYCGNDRED